MAVRKYTNRPDLAKSDPSYVYVDPTGQKQMGGEPFFTDYPSDDTDIFRPGEAAYDPYGYDASTGYAPAPTGNPYQDLRRTARFKSNRAMGGRDVSGGGLGDLSQYPKMGQDPAKATTPGGGGGGSYRGTQYKPSVGRITTRRTTYGEKFPEAPTLREVDKRRVKELTQKNMAPRLRLLRSALQRALVRSYENPNVRRMIVREALQGYGQGVEEARAGAERMAMGEEREERGTANQNLMLAYANAMEKYKASSTTTETSRDIFDPSEARSISASGEESKRTGSLSMTRRSTGMRGSMRALHPGVMI
ncbi:MAG: hypothetical protein ACW99J_15910 [Candidatus Thorarchaeota archaeon]|jgi:hypothetical protein